MDHENYSHDHNHEDEHQHTIMNDGNLLEEQSQIAQEIGSELTDAFVAYVRGDVSFDDLVFGVFDALSDLNVVASGEYELEELDSGDEGETDV